MVRYAHNDRLRRTGADSIPAERPAQIVEQLPDVLPVLPLPSFGALRTLPARVQHAFNRFAVAFLAPTFPADEFSQTQQNAGALPAFSVVANRRAFVMENQ